MSASLWGCELKYVFLGRLFPSRCQPPCEAVNWNILCYVYFFESGCQPPCEAVNWNLTSTSFPVFSDPVSLLVRLWIEIWSGLDRRWWTRSASLWGCELKYQQYGRNTKMHLVSLLVRLWIEIFTYNSSIRYIFVSLLVRLWIEIQDSFAASDGGKGQPPCEAVNWNNSADEKGNEYYRQPPCEAVNWNVGKVSATFTAVCQPPCEAVNWNSHSSTYTNHDSRQPPCEAVNWNFFQARFVDPAWCQPPCEAVNWNRYRTSVDLNDLVSLLVRLWIEMIDSVRYGSESLSASLWGCELKLLLARIGAIRSTSASLWGCELKLW